MGIHGALLIGERIITSAESGSGVSGVAISPFTATVASAAASMPMTSRRSATRARGGSA